LIGVLIIIVWGAAAAALIRRDVLPFWYAEQRATGAPQEDGEFQLGVFLGDRRVGTSWTKSVRNVSLTNVNSATVLETSIIPLPVVKQRMGSRILFDTTLNFQTGGALSSFDTQVYGLPVSPIRLEGQLLGIDYSCVARFGDVQQKFSIDARLSRELGESLRPFTNLSDLKVGQSWQLNIIDPISLLSGVTPDFRRVLVRVTRRETIQLDGRSASCFRVESDMAVAWVNDEGRVLKQTIQMPLIGTITLLDEPYDARKRHRVKRELTPRPTRIRLDVDHDGIPASRESM
jgi:hypothetical protein